jgi:aspartyl-tRNA(Asn)/glutamyl-tRNA(Gln) amidotransferase subunit A
MVVDSPDVAYLSAAELAARYRRTELSPVELTRALLDRIERLQPTLRAFITVTADVALAEARAAEAALLRGDERPLLGVPAAYKDIYLTAGVRTTAGSRLHERDVPDRTATTVRRLHEAGAVMLGKLATHEFALGITPEDHPFPPARNPWSLAHIPGGSSSGSGTALAGGLVAGALGTDTGGSIRHPGAACGIAALKPTYGRCSRAGVYPLSWSLDHTGPMARTVRDCALLLTAMAGFDAADPASARVPAEDYARDLDTGVRDLRVGVLRSYYEPTAAAAVGKAVEEALAVLGDLGARVVAVEIPHVELTKVYSVIMLSEAYAYHAPDLAERPDAYAPTTRERLRAGGLSFAREYLDAQRARQLLMDEVEEALRSVDLLVTPTRGETAMTFAEAYEDYTRGPSYTHLYNLTGLPAISVPCGFDERGLPIGLQLGGRPFDEATVLRAAHAYERATAWHRRHPDLDVPAATRQGGTADGG